MAVASLELSQNSVFSLQTKLQNLSLSGEAVNAMNEVESMKASCGLRGRNGAGCRAHQYWCGFSWSGGLLDLFTGAVIGVWGAFGSSRLPLPMTD